MRRKKLQHYTDFRGSEYEKSGLIATRFLMQACYLNATVRV